MWRLPQAMIVAAVAVGVVGAALAVPFEQTWMYEDVTETLRISAGPPLFSEEERQRLAVPPGIPLLEFLVFPGLLLLAGLTAEWSRRVGKLGEGGAWVSAACAIPVASFAAAIIATPPDVATTIAGTTIIAAFGALVVGVVLVLLVPVLRTRPQ